MIKDTLSANEAVLPNSREMEILKEHFPACFHSDGSFDLVRFQEFLSNKVAITNEGYELRFLGKNYARLLASVDTTTVIVPDEEHNSKPENAHSENVYISGDNLDGLKHLLKSYSHKIKCIYIDPPYNTGKDEFAYNDSFNFTIDDLTEKLSISETDAKRIIDLTKRGSSSHSAWLLFMYPRLLLARDLLSSDGVILVSIDDNEQANLKMILDDVFGEENLIGTIIWKNATDNGKKLQNAIESNTLEMGFSSGEKVFHRINNYLHFFLGNSLFMDEFAEFKNTIRNLMSLLVYKYSVQEKKVFDKDWLEGLSENKILFDELDFYCFITYFDEKELRKMFSKYGVKTIEMNNIDVIAKSVLNIFDYYDILIQTKASAIEALSCQQKIKVCIALLCYMDIPQDLVDAVCKFIFKYEFREIDISDKVAFLDAQIWKRKKYSEITSTVIENKLIFYLDKHIKSIETGKKFELYSHSSIVNYCNLVHYIHAGESFTSRRLSIRVSKIVRNDYTQFKKAIERHYYSHISANQKRSFTSWVKRDLPQSTDFSDFRFLISNQVRLEKKEILALKKHLQKMVANEEANEEGIKYRTFPSHEPYEDLQDIGYYCFIGYLPKRQFKGFLGYSPKFDFFYKYRSFDFDKFEVAWLLHWQPHVLDELVKNCTVKEKIRNLLAKELSSSELNDLEKKKLERILVKHFC